MVRYSERKKLGTWAEELYAEHLSKLGFTVDGKYKGTYGDPDVVAEKDNLKLAFEVKLTRLWHGKHVGRLRIHRVEWDNLIAFCKDTEYKPMLGIVIKPNRSVEEHVTGPILFYLDGNIVTQRIIQRNPRTATSLTTYQILAHGNKLENILRVMFPPNKKGDGSTRAIFP